jgi:hypothetical protein
MELIDMLDKVLQWFATDIKDYATSNVVPQPRSGEDKNIVIKRMINDYPDLNTSEFTEYADAMLRKLVKDNYLEIRNDRYWITLDGKLFYLQGGYRAEFDRDRHNMQIAYLQIKMARKHQNGILAATVVAGLYYLIEVLKFLHVVPSRP